MDYKQIKNAALTGAFVFFAFSAFATEGDRPVRTIELGFVAYAKSPKYYAKSKETRELAALRAAGADPVILPEDIDIFLPENDQKAAKCKRIWIPRYAYSFSQKARDGMKKYVADGGLLITGDSMVIVAPAPGDKPAPKEIVKTNPIVGVSGMGGATYDKMTVSLETPLTEGFPLNQWLDFKYKLNGRYIAAGGGAAITVALAHGSNRLNASYEQPFLLYRQFGKGACVYLVCGAENEPSALKIMKNILSATTLRWLCA